MSGKVNAQLSRSILARRSVTKEMIASVAGVTASGCAAATRSSADTTGVIPLRVRRTTRAPRANTTSPVVPQVEVTPDPTPSTMSTNASLPAMPAKGHPTAPTFDPNDPFAFHGYFLELETLFKQHRKEAMGRPISSVPHRRLVANASRVQRRDEVLRRFQEGPSNSLSGFRR